MRIDGVEVYYVAMPLIYPWRTAYGSDPVIESVLVKFTSGDSEASLSAFCLFVNKTAVSQRCPSALKKSLW